MTLNKYQKFNDSLNSDFIEIFNDTKNLWKKIKNQNIFLTGCTGFFGYWILKSFSIANKKLKLKATAYVLTRQKNIKKSLIYKLCKDPSIVFYNGDIRNFKYPKKKFKFIIHGATTSARETFENQDPLVKANTIIEGTKYILEFAKSSFCKNFMYLSSGAVYGNYSPSNEKVTDKSLSAPLTNDKNFNLNALGNSKRISELLVSIYSDKKYFNTKIARCFSFIGPFIPLDIHYAVGNFLKRSVLKKPIKINSDGSALRSYMYMSDLTTWLITILFSGKNNEIYNVGSEDKINIMNLAKLINRLTKNNNKIQYNKIKRKTVYIPSNKKIRKELKVKQKIKLNEAILKTYNNIINNKNIYY